MPVVPLDVDTFAGSQVHFDGFRVWRCHGSVSQKSSSVVGRS
jgi:hypothetical protein